MTHVICESPQPGILQVRMNRPDRLNALNPSLIQDLITTFTALQRDRETRVVILTGVGKGFCAGADLQETVHPGGIPGTDGMGHLGFVYKFQEYLVELMLAIHECDKPVIAAVNGAAIGGGLGLALASDMRVASSTARFGVGAIKAGLSGADMGTSYFLPRLIGAGQAADLMLTGRLLDADEAMGWRLVSRVVPANELESVSLNMARSIAENPPYGVWMTKKTLRSNIDAPSLRHALELENRTQVLGTFTGGMQEAMEAFSQGRAPHWKPL